MSRHKNSSQKIPKIVLTGGGTGGHVIPTLAVATELRKLAPRVELSYLGSHDSIESRLAHEAGLPFYGITVGKLRRYFSLQNIADAFRVPVGILQSVRLLRQLQPDAVFAKGGFVSVPPAIAARLLGIPLIIHESDLTLGLATKITSHFATKICLSFPTPNTNLPTGQAGTITNTILTGNPIRPLGSAADGRKFLGFKNRRPIILVTGGSTGAQYLNELIPKIATEITKKANLVWLTGPGKQPATHKRDIKTSSVRVFDFLAAEYPAVLTATDLVISRAGANALFELAAAGRPSVLIPLPTAGSRGDQILNAEFFAEAGASELVLQEELSPTRFTELILNLLADKPRLQRMGAVARRLAPQDAARKIARLILEASGV